MISLGRPFFAVLSKLHNVPADLNINSESPMFRWPILEIEPKSEELSNPTDSALQQNFNVIPQQIPTSSLFPVAWMPIPLSILPIQDKKQANSVISLANDAKEEIMEVERLRNKDRRIN